MSEAAQWLESQTLYPKIMIGDQAAAGCAALSHTLGDPGDVRWWGGIEFAGPWKTFWLPQKQWIDGREVHHSGQTAFPDMPDMISGNETTFAQWKEMLESIDWNQMQKVVLARRVSEEMQCDPYDMLSQLAGGIPYLFQPSPDLTFLGCTPEHLFERNGRQLETEALAGTATTEEALKTEKNLREFEWVRKEIRHQLDTLCIEHHEGAIAVKPAGRVCHLHTLYTGHLKPGISDFDVLTALHPTPAMGGTPTQDAIDLIQRLESFNRGLYTAPLGYFSKEHAKFIVNIRCALMDKKRMHFYSGAGIVKGSDPEMEWDELNHKTKAWRCKIQEFSTQ